MGDTDFAQHAYRCGFQSMGNAYRSGRCMAKTQHVSAECGTCMGNYIHCGLHCLHECCFGKCYTREQCVACQVKNCHDDFIACAGMPPPPMKLGEGLEHAQVNL